ncbi:MAG: hypothetical protein U0271_23245 [Polyangiaceae bacterium]
MARITTVVIVMFAFPVLVACGDSGTGGTGGLGGGGSAGAGGAAGSGGAPPELTCDYYCSTIDARCFDGNQQYSTVDDCLAVCDSFPVGALGDTTGDSLGCRIYQVGFTKKAADTKCAHAGPSGGDQRGGAGGICGDGCEAFCNLEMQACTGANQQYATNDDCMTACDAFPGSAAADDFDTGDTSGDTFNCRLYHATAAATDPDIHCTHTKVGTPNDPCVM